MDYEKEIFKIPFTAGVYALYQQLRLIVAVAKILLIRLLRKDGNGSPLGFDYYVSLKELGLNQKRKPFKHGCAKLALSLDVPIVPFAHNAGYCLPKNSFGFIPYSLNSNWEANLSRFC